MKKNIYIIVCVCALFLLASCDANGTSLPPDTTENSEQADSQTDQPTETESQDKPTLEDPLLDSWSDDVDTTFSLSDEEQKLFDEYTKSLDVSVFKGVAPASIAQVFIQCGIEAKWEAEYAMYAQEGLTATKEEWKQLNDTDIEELNLSTRKLQADYFFPYLKDGVFTEEGNKGVLTFTSGAGDETSMHFVKTDDGIWLVRYNPF